MRRIVLIQPRRDGRVFGKSPGSPYTLMRLASLVPAEIPVEIWDENVRDIDLSTLREGDLVGITSMTVTIERAENIARRAMKQGAGVVLGGVHATLMPEHSSTFAHSVMVGEGYFTWQQVIKDFGADGIKGMKPRYEDERWADLAGLATITDRVIQMVDENNNYWTPYLEITRGCPRNCDFCTAIRVSGRRMRLRPIDEVVDEIAGLAHACESAGAEVRWLTGRIEPLKEASVRWLRRYQLPAPNNVYCKPDLSIRTGPFKGQMLDQWHRELGVSLFITEDVRDIIAAQAHNDAVPCVLFDFPLRFEGVPRAGTPVFQANSLTRPKIS